MSESLPQTRPAPECEAVTLDLLLSASLCPSAAAHAASCPRCRAMMAAIASRPPALARPSLPCPQPSALRRRARARTARRLGLTAALATALALIGVVAAPDATPVTPSSEPDLIALLDEVSGIPSSDTPDPPGTEALALLDPLGADPFATLSDDDPLSDLFTPWSTK